MVTLVYVLCDVVHSGHLSEWKLLILVLLSSMGWCEVEEHELFPAISTSTYPVRQHMSPMNGDNYMSMFQLSEQFFYKLVGR